MILPRDLQIEGLNDSKKLTDKKRRELFDVITAQAVSYGIAFADEKEIDEINILQATFRAMARAIAALDPKPQLALIDGNRAADFGLPVPFSQHCGGIDPCKGDAGPAHGALR